MIARVATALARPVDPAVNAFAADVSEESAFTYQAPIMKLSDSNEGTRVFVTADGNVGVGTDRPAQQLHVAGGGAQIDGTIHTVGITALGDKLDVRGDLELHSSANVAGELRVGGHAQFDSGIGLDSTTTIGDTVVEGTVGIGTSSPAERLHVAQGNAQIDGSIAVGADGGG